MHKIVRGGTPSIIVGWMLIGMGFAAIAVGVILAFALAQPLFALIALGSVMAFAGGGLNLYMGYSARLEILPDRFIWCGFFGSPRSLPWHAVQRIYLPPPGSQQRLAAIAALRDGTFVEIESLWEPPTSPGNLMLGPNHAEAQRALIEGHKAYLAGVGHH